MRVRGCQGSAYSGQREASIADGIRAVDYHAVLMCRLGRCLWETSLSSSLRLSRANVRAWATEGMSHADGAQRLESEGSWKDDLSDSHRRVRGKMLKSSRVGYGGDADGAREFADGTGGRVVRREEQRISGEGVTRGSACRDCVASDLRDDDEYHAFRVELLQCQAAPRPVVIV